MLKYVSDLEIFSLVVTTQSMSEAGRALGASPAVISKSILRLETSLGVRLFHRTTRQVVATEIGRALHEKVTSILGAIEDAEALASGRTSEISGTLRVSVPTSFGRLHIAPHLVRFMQAYPQLSVDIILSDNFTDIIGDGFDLAIRISVPEESALVARRLAPVRRILCASPAYLSRWGCPERVEDLSHHFCIPPHNGEAWRLEGPDGAFVYKPDGQLKTNSSEVVREVAISGLGIALRSTWDIGSELSSGRLVRVLPDYEGAKDVCISALFPSRQYLASKVRVFIDFLLEIYGPVPYWDHEA